MFAVSRLLRQVQLRLLLKLARLAPHSSQKLVSERLSRWPQTGRRGVIAPNASNHTNCEPLPFSTFPRGRARRVTSGRLQYDQVMAREMAEARGRITIRPWRVAVLVDTSSAEALRGAIDSLSGVWGGIYMPILDVNAPQEDLERLGDQYDIDSLYAEDPRDELAELLQRPGWVWSGRGEWGPFGEGGGFRKGPLPARAFIDASTDLIQPTWDPGNPLDLVFAATWGLVSDRRLGLVDDSADSGPRTKSYLEVLARTSASRSIVGILNAGKQHIAVGSGSGLSGVYVIRPDHPGDIVDFWNRRSCGSRIVGVPADGPKGLLSHLLSVTLPGVALKSGGEEEQAVFVQGLEDASAGVVEAIQSAALRDGLSIHSDSRGHAGAEWVFQGLRTPFTRSIRADFSGQAQSVDASLPRLPLRDEPEAFWRGVVAAEVELHSVKGQDPRLTAVIPPFRRHSALLHRVASLEGFDHARVTQLGVALGVDATQDHVQVPFATNLDVMHLLFDDDAVSVAQSDVGKFQSRAAEKFSGPFSGLFNQPGIRAAIMDAAGKDSGVPLPRLRGVAESNRGEWPDPLFASRLEPKEYAKRVVNSLFYGGLFVPIMRIHCSNCRVERHASADELRSTMSCEFCGQPFNLALSNSLTNAGWNYRLAAHLRAEQVQALLPALAVTSVLAQLRHVEEPPLSHVLGLEVETSERKVEVDVAAYLPEPEWTAVLGEVKSANRIDAKDIQNLESLQQRLMDKGVRCLLLFATLKPKFAAEEVAELRQLIFRTSPITTASGTRVQNLPLVLTGPDLSQPPGSQDHPWQWKKEDFSSGIFGTARESCERNLGLRQHRFVRSPEGGGHFEYDWEPETVSPG